MLFRSISERRVVPEIAVPMFGYKNHVGIDRECGFVRRYAVTRDGAQLGQVLDREHGGFRLGG